MEWNVSAHWVELAAIPLVTAGYLLYRRTVDRMVAKDKIESYITAGVCILTLGVFYVVVFGFRKAAAQDHVDHVYKQYKERYNACAFRAAQKLDTISMMKFTSASVVEQLRREFERKNQMACKLEAVKNVMELSLKERAQLDSTCHADLKSLIQDVDSIKVERYRERETRFEALLVDLQKMRLESGSLILELQSNKDTDKDEIIDLLTRSNKAFEEFTLLDPTKEPERMTHFSDVIRAERP